MKNLMITFLLVTCCLAVTNAQETTIKGLTPFDKLVVSGKIGEVRLSNASDEAPYIHIEGIPQENVSSSVTAGTLYLTIKDNSQPVRLEVCNGRLKRIHGPADMRITGAEVLGGSSGNYLVVSFDRHNDFEAWAMREHNIDVHIPDIDVDIPELDFAVDIPEMDFDFDFDFDPENFDFDFDVDFDHGFDEDWKEDFQYNWENHKKEIKEWSKEWKQEMKEAMDEAKEEMKRMKKDN